MQGSKNHALRAVGEKRETSFCKKERPKLCKLWEKSENQALQALGKKRNQTLQALRDKRKISFRKKERTKLCKL